MEVILSWWKSVNVKSKFLSHRKRDDLRAPITSQNLLEKTSFFRGFVDWLQAWGESTQTSRTGLTKETFQASKQTSEGLAGLSEFLILERKMNYFLTGKCQSDKIEGRFGQMRQMSGGNLYASVRQFLESDRTLRIKNLAALELSMSKISDIFNDSKRENEDKIKEIATELVLSFDCENSIETNPEIPDSDKNIIFYVAGYCARTLSRRTKCILCKELLLAEENVDGINVIEENCSDETREGIEKNKEYISLVSRGGLVYPSELTFSASVLVWSFYQAIKSQPEKFNLLHSPNVSAQKVFENAFLKYLDSFEETRLSFILKTCDAGHSFSLNLHLLTKKLFNVFSKNFVSNVNSKIHENKKRRSDDDSKRNSLNQKIVKLQSESI